MEPLIPPGNFNQLTPTRYGPMLYNRHDTYVGRSLEVFGEWCESEVRLFQQIVRPGDVVVDVGANIGSHTVPLAQAVGPRGDVYAFEPQRVVYQTLCANLALNSLRNVKAYMMAVGAERGSALVPFLDYELENNFGALRLKAGWEQGESVDVVMLDMLELQACRLIKIDVEEMELDVLRGGLDTLQRLRPFLYVENNPGELAGPLIRYLDSIDYRMYWHITPYFNPENFKGAPRLYPENLYSHNMICVHKSVEVTMAGFEEVKVPAPSGG